MSVIIGIDPHKSSHTATALDAGLAELGTIRVRATRVTIDQLLSWAAPWPERRWAIEGARGLGQLVAQRLIAAGEIVVDVPATLAARARLLETGHGRKTDRIDARGVAVVAAQRPDLAVVAADDHTRVLRLLADRRDELTRERRRAMNRLHRHLRDLIPGGAPLHLSATKATALLAKVRPGDAVETERKQVARDLLTDIRRLDKAIMQNRRRCAAAVAASGTTLTQITGLSDVLAAKILRTRRRRQPVPERRLSRQPRRHRTNRSLQRRRCPSPPVAAREPAVEQRDPPRSARADHLPGPGRDHYQRRLATGSSRTEALRALKRQLTKAIYRTLVADAVHPSLAAAA